MASGYWGLQKVSTWALGHTTSLFKLKDGTTFLGRATENDIKCKSVQVSRKHCSISIENGRVFLKDNKSFNGTFIGDNRIPPLREISLVDGDMIGLGAESSEPLCHYVFKLIFFPHVTETPVDVSTNASCVKSSNNHLAEEKVDDVASSSRLKGDGLENEEGTSRKRTAMSPPPIPLKIARIVSHSKREDEEAPSVMDRVSNEVVKIGHSETGNSLIDNCVTMCLDTSDRQSDKEISNSGQCDQQTSNSRQCGKQISSSMQSDQQTSNSRSSDHETSNSRQSDQETSKYRLSDKDASNSGQYDHKTSSSRQSDHETSNSTPPDQETSKYRQSDKETSNSRQSDRETSKYRQSDKETSNSGQSDHKTSSSRQSDKETSNNRPPDKETSNNRQPDKETSNSRPSDQETSKYRQCDQETSNSRPSDQETSNSGQSDHEMSNSRQSDKETSNSRPPDQETSNYRQCNQETSNSRKSDKGISNSRQSDQEMSSSRPSDQGTSNSRQSDNKTTNSMQSDRNQEFPCYTDKPPEPELNPFNSVTIKRGTGKQNNISKNSIEDSSLMNASAFSQADEDIIEIVDSDDDDVPCSQLFKSNDEEMVEHIAIKKEVEDESGSDSDVEIIEDECSFFEDYFSQNYRESSPRKEEKPVIETICIEHGDKVELLESNELAEKRGESEEKQSDSSCDENVLHKTDNEHVLIILEDERLDDKVRVSSRQSTKTPKKAIFPLEDLEMNNTSKSKTADEKDKDELDSVSEKGKPDITTSSSKLDQSSHVIIKDDKLVENKTRKRIKTILCEALPLPSVKTRARNNTILSERKSDKKYPNKSPNNTTKEPMSKKLKNNIINERKEKLKRLSSKDKSKEKTDTVATAVKQTAFNCSKVTDKNRGSFLTETVTSVKPIKGNTTSKKISSPKIKENVKSQLGNVIEEEEERVKHNQRRNKKKEGAIDSSEMCIGVPKIKGRIPKKPLKKTVKFNDKNLVEVREYECDGILNKIQPKVKDLMVKVDDINPKNYVEGIPNTLMDIVYVICKWNAVWLEECKRFEGEPPVADLMLVSALKESFMSYSEYQKTFISLQLYDLWATTVQELEVTNNQALSGIVTHSEVEVIDEGMTKIMQKLHCCALVGRNDIVTANYPKGGDFVVVQLSLKNEVANVGKNQPPKNLIFNAFGYVAHHSRMVKLHHCRDMNVQHLVANVKSSPSKKQNVQPDSCAYFTLLLRQRDKRIDGNSWFKIKVLRNLNKDMRIFDAIGMLPFSPLSCTILDPTKFNLGCPPLQKKNLFWQSPLNESQTTAVLKSAHSVFEKKPSISLIHGPPGTGKTNVILALILQVLYAKKKESTRKQPRPRILLCAPSNTAVDEMVLRLLHVRKQLPANHKFKLVRHGRKKAMHPIVADISTESLAERELISSSDPESIQIELSVLRAQERAISMTLEENPLDVNMGKYREKYTNIQQQIIDMEKLLRNGLSTKANFNDMNHQTRRQMREMEARVLHCADIIATTLSSSFSSQMKEAFNVKDDRFNKKFTCCIVDEATQASEPESLLPLLLNVENLILVGDPNQLPATVISQTAKDLGLGRSLFARLFSAWSSRPNTPIYKLNVQYRMHPEIAKWPAAYFYCNQLLSAPNLETERNIQLTPYMVITHPSKQDHIGESNTGESVMVSSLVKAIQSCEMFKDLSIGIIVPYQKQKSMIYNTLSSMKLDKNQLIMVQTIDSYQGQEKDIVIMSCVRTEGIGFLADPQRLNVALTRAKSSLIVFANFSSLQGSSTWNCMLNDARKRCRITELQNSQVTGDELLSIMIRNVVNKES